MAAQGDWVYERVASGAEANGETCIFCGKRIVDEMRPGQWVRKAEEDHADADYVTASGYAHRECTEKHLAEQRRDPFAIPPPPDIPRRT
jgi:hypothetical protein